jgi:hypothetical protein
MSKQSFHIQHNTFVSSVEAAIAIISREEPLVIIDYAEAQGIAESVAEKLVLPFLRQSSILDKNRELTTLGKRLARVREERPELLGEAMHVQLYSLYQTNPSARFSFAYATLCDWLCERGEFTLDSDGQATLVSIVLERAREELGLDPDTIAFSKTSIQGASHWLETTDPPALIENQFRRRHAAPLHTILWLIDRLYRQRDIPHGVRISLDEDIETYLCHGALLDPTALYPTLDIAQRTFDANRRDGFFSIGSEGGFGRFLLLSRPLPLGALEPIEDADEETMIEPTVWPEEEQDGE